MADSREGDQHRGNWESKNPENPCDVVHDVLADIKDCRQRLHKTCDDEQPQADFPARRARLRTPARASSQDPIAQKANIRDSTQP